MINKIITIFVCCFTTSAFAQDTIVLLDKSNHIGKVEEINPTEIKYKRVENLNGPTYVLESNKVFCIKYFDGSVDTINKKQAIAPIIKVEAPVVNTERSKMVGSPNGQIFCDNHNLSIYEIRRKILDVSDATKKRNLINEFEKIQRYSNNQTISNVLGWTVGFGVPILVTGLSFGIIGSNGYTTQSVFSDHPGESIVVGALTGALIRTMGQVFSKINKNKKKHQYVVIANMYNQ